VSKLLFLFHLNYNRICWTTCVKLHVQEQNVLLQTHFLPSPQRFLGQILVQLLQLRNRRI
jgi:hypothetical protein